MGHADGFYLKYGLSLVRPAELVGRFEELRNEPAYQHERLAGTSIDKSRLSRPSQSMVSAFQDPKGDEKKWQLEQKINTYLSAPNRYNCFLVADASGSTVDPSPLAFYVSEKVSDYVRKIPLFRLSASVRKTRTASTLFRTLVAGIVEHACRSHTSVVIFEEANAEAAWSERSEIRGSSRWGDHG